MKQILIMLVLIFGCKIVYAQIYSYGNNWHQYKVECIICDKDIYGYSQGSGGMGSFNTRPHSTIYELFDIYESYDVCERCGKLYSYEFKKMLEGIIEIEIKKLRDVNEDHRKTVQDKEELERKNDIKEQIKNLQDQLEGKSLAPKFRNNFSTMTPERDNE